MTNVKAVADAADMIINGYAFTKDGRGIRVLNLNRPDKASVLAWDGEILETSMDDIELKIVQDYFAQNRKFMED